MNSAEAFTPMDREEDSSIGFIGTRNIKFVNVAWHRVYAALKSTYFKDSNSTMKICQCCHSVLEDSSEVAIRLAK